MKIIRRDRATHIILEDDVDSQLLNELENISLFWHEQLRGLEDQPRLRELYRRLKELK